MRDGPLALFTHVPQGVPTSLQSPSLQQWNPGDWSLEDGWWHVRMDWCGKDTVGCDLEGPSLQTLPRKWVLRHIWGMGSRRSCSLQKHGVEFTAVIS